MPLLRPSGVSVLAGRLWQLDSLQHQLLASLRVSFFGVPGLGFMAS